MLHHTCALTTPPFISTTCLTLPCSTNIPLASNAYFPLSIHSILGLVFTVMSFTSDIVIFFIKCPSSFPSKCAHQICSHHYISYIPESHPWRIALSRGTCLPCSSVTNHSLGQYIHLFYLYRYLNLWFLWQWQSCVMLLMPSCFLCALTMSSQLLRSLLPQPMWMQTMVVRLALLGTNL